MADDAIFALVLLLSLPVGGLLPLVSPSARGSVASAVGGVLAVLACGLRCAAYALGSILLTCAVLRLAPRGRHGPVCFACAFGCLFTLRLLAAPSGPANALQLVLTLRLASLGWDSADGAIGASQSTPAVATLVQYALCYHGLLSGPFVRYSDWAIAMSHPAGPPTAETWAAAGRALAGAAGALTVWRGAAWLLPYGPMAAADAWWLALPLNRRVAYFYLSSYQQRFRFHACWLLMEAAGALARFPHPANVRPLTCETAGSPSSLITSWNVSVHRFLRDYVHRRLPMRSRTSRKLVTYALSAAWHGLRPGYYLFFLGLFAMVGVEELVRAAAASVAPPPPNATDTLFAAGGKHNARRPTAGTADVDASAGPSRIRILMARGLAHPLTHLLCHLWTMGCLSYFGAAFNVLGFRATMELWRSVGFYGLWMLAAPAAVAAAVIAGAAGGAEPPPTANGHRQHQA